jgi:predicted peptidase
MIQVNNKYFFFFLLFFSATTAFPQASRFSKRQYISPQGDTLNYRLLSPDYNTGRKYPLVVFLHGSGERGHDNEAQLQWGVLNFSTDENMMLYPAYVVAPQCAEGMSWSNFTRQENRSDLKLSPKPSRPMELLISLIDSLKKRMKVDDTRIYITGLSMGGYGTFDAIQRYPNLFAAAVPVCGGGDTSKVSLIKHLPIWIYHGTEDPAVSPVLSLNMVNALSKAGAIPGFTLLPEVGHFSWIAAYSDQRMLQWLFRQHK